LNINLGIHKKFPEVLTWENLCSFKCAADFAFYIEKFNDELTISIEKRAKDTGMWLFEKKNKCTCGTNYFFCVTANNKQKKNNGVDDPLELLKQLDLSDCDLGRKVDDFVKQTTWHSSNNFIVFCS
jgi:hypothetical protein